MPSSNYMGMSGDATQAPVPSQIIADVQPGWRMTAVVLKAWTLDQQRQHHLVPGNLLECRFLAPTPALQRNENH